MHSLLPTFTERKNKDTSSAVSKREYKSNFCNKNLMGFFAIFLFQFEKNTMQARKTKNHVGLA